MHSPATTAVYFYSSQRYNAHSQHTIYSGVGYKCTIFSRYGAPLKLSKPLRVCLQEARDYNVAKAFGKACYKFERRRFCGGCRTMRSYMATSKPAAKVVYRSSVDGKFTTQKQAEKKPREHQREHVPTPASKPTPSRGR